MRPLPRSFLTVGLSLVLGLGLAAGQTAASLPPVAHWVGTWATAPVSETVAKELKPLPGSTLRQVVHVSLGGDQLRVRLSNAFGTTPLVISSAHLAVSAGQGAIRPESDRVLLFAGKPSVTIPPGAAWVSDPLDFPLAPQADLALSLSLQTVPVIVTAHGGARTTSYQIAGDAAAAAAVPADAIRYTRWYFINGIDVRAGATDAAAIVLLGDSITDGYGSTTDRNNRWPDELARRLQARPETARLGVLNLGIGGNRLLRDGLGPNAIARVDRDVLTQNGTKWLVVFEGINDIGTRLDARKKGADYASAADLIAALEQIAARAHARGLKVFGATITPYGGAGFYWSEDGEADRQAVNAWIRHSASFDAVIDFDAALRDPADPTRLAAAFDSGDHLHPSVAGYKHLAEAVDLELFTR